jgi:hypothetical protein
MFLIQIGSIDSVPLKFIKENAEWIMKSSPIPYVREAKPRGSLFDPEGSSSDLVSSVDTGFFVDHKEPLKALAWVQESTHWPLGELLDGLEFVLVLEVRRRRSKALSLPRS